MLFCLIQKKAITINSKKSHNTTQYPNLSSAILHSAELPVPMLPNRPHNQDPRCVYLKVKFSKLNKAKIKEEIFVSPQIRQLVKDKSFEEKLNDQEKLASKCFVNVVQNPLGNQKSKIDIDLINKFLMSYKVSGVICP